MKNRKYINQDRITDIVINLILAMVAIVSIYPIWYVLIASISSPSAISMGEVILIPKGFNLSAYTSLLNNKLIWRGYRNTIVYTFFGTLLDLVVQISAAYAVSRPRLPGRKWLMTMFIITMYFSGGMIPKYLLLSKLDMVNTPLALIIPGCANVFNIIVAKSFFENNVPESLFDAARIDGCSYTRFFIKIVLPLSPALLAIIALYCIQGHWNTYLTAQMYIYDTELYTLQQVIRTITATLDASLSDSMSPMEMIESVREKQLLKFSVIVVSVVPMIIVYPFVQKFFVRGVMVGAVKG